MADKLTLFELHLHADNNRMENELELNSDIGEVVRRRFGFGGGDEGDAEPTIELGTEDEAGSSSLSEMIGLGGSEDDAEPESEVETEPEPESEVEIDPEPETDTEPESEAEASVDEADAFESTDEPPEAAVVEIDAPAEADEADETDESGGLLGRLLTLLLLVGVGLGVRWYLGGDDLEDEFEEL